MGRLPRSQKDDAEKMFTVTERHMVYRCGEIASPKGVEDLFRLEVQPLEACCCKPGIKPPKGRPIHEFGQLVPGNRIGPRVRQ